jgi:hypothetical protein
MWRMALPTITSNIPSYSKVMEESNINLCADDNDSWRSLILSFCKNTEKRKKSGINGKKYVDELYSNNKIDLLWSNCINMLQK